MILRCVQPLPPLTTTYSTSQSRWAPPVLASKLTAQQTHYLLQMTQAGVCLGEDDALSHQMSKRSDKRLKWSANRFQWCGIPTEKTTQDSTQMTLIQAQPLGPAEPLHATHAYIKHTLSHAYPMMTTQHNIYAYISTNSSTD